MPHQCLKCGKVYPDGSSEVLKGCSGCGGTRFFYTKEKLDDGAREKLQAKADEDLRNVVEQIMSSKEKPNYRDPVWNEQSRKAWVKLTPEELRAAICDISSEMRAQKGSGDKPIGVISSILSSDGIKEGEEPISQIEAKLQGVSPADVLERQIKDEKMPIQKIAEMARESSKLKPAPERTPEQKPIKAEAEMPQAAPKPAPDAKPAMQKPPAPAKQIQEKPKAESTGLAEKVVKPETVEIVESGVYQIDVKDLMEHAPIIVQKDGSYLIHLASAFESAKPAPKKKARIKNR